MKAALNRYRQSPRKVRSVADLVRGRTVSEALNYLDNLPRRAALPLAKLIRSAVVNPSAGGPAPLDLDRLIIKEIRVDKGATLKRIRPRAMGRAYRINKRTSRIKVVIVPKLKANHPKATN